MARKDFRKRILARQQGFTCKRCQKWGSKIIIAMNCKTGRWEHFGAGLGRREASAGLPALLGGDEDADDHGEEAEG